MMHQIDNLLGINNEVEFAKEEERLSKTRAMQLWDDNILDTLTPGTVDSLLHIHRYIFQDIYEFAGKLRKVDILKDDFRFCPWRYLSQELDRIDNDYPISTFREIVEKYAELNVAHPFREGNGRSLRLWLDFVVEKKLRKRIRWDNISRDEYMDAMKRSHVRTGELRVLLEDNLVDSDGVTREVFAHSLNVSYLYEHYDAYDAKDL